MKIFQHVTNTWLVAQAIHPFLFVIIMSLSIGHSVMDAFSFIILYSIIFSLPAYGMCLILLKYILLLKVNVGVRMLVWVIGTALTIIITYFLICLFFFNLEAFFEGFRIIVSGVIAAGLSILIRKRSFEILVKQKEIEQQARLA